MSSKKMKNLKSIQMILMICLSVTLSAAEIVTGDITLEWNDNSDNETGFRIDYQKNGGTWTLLNSVEPNVTTYGPFAFDPVDTYAFRVFAFNEYGNSEPTNIVEVVFQAPTVDAPTISAIHHSSLNRALLDWTTVSNATGYNVYRDATARFTPDKTGGSNRIAQNVNDADPSTSGIQWTDTNAGVGTEGINYFYIVTALIGSTVESENSNTVGDFDFALITTATTDFNEIALPLETPGINTAQDLMNAIPNCNSVARWNAPTQSYQQYVPGIPPTNFAIQAGNPYYVNVTANSVFSLLGGEVMPNYSLVTTPTTDFNEIMLPLGKENITKASQLMADIPNCNSVAYWNAPTQSYKQYVPGIPPTDFTVIPGHPYYVNVTANSTWPESGLSKSVPANVAQLSSLTTATSSPHIVWGEMDLSVDISGLSLLAYIVSRPQEMLTHASPGCTLASDYWMIQCSSFPSPWKAGEILKVVLADGQNIIFTTEIELTYDPSDQASMITGVNETAQIPVEYELRQNYPNPFNPNTTIPYQVSAASEVNIVIFNSMGQRVKQLVSGYQAPGFYQVDWNGLDDENNKVGSGIYFIHMESSGYTKTRKMTLLQ